MEKEKRPRLTTKKVDLSRYKESKNEMPTTPKTPSTTQTKKDKPPRPKSPARPGMVWEWVQGITCPEGQWMQIPE